MNTAQTTERLLTPREAADRLCISERKLWALTMPRGSLPCVRIARSVRYAVHDLDGFVARMTTTMDA